LTINVVKLVVKFYAVAKIKIEDIANLLLGYFNLSHPVELCVEYNV